MTPGIGEPEGGPSARFLAGCAAEHGVWVGGSCPEVAADGSLPYNSFVLAGPGGEVHRYRKLHPFTHGGEHERFRAGEGPVTVTIGGLRITPFVCYDLRFADVFWAAAAHTDVYLVTANWPAARREHWTTLLRARAIENQAYVVGCNRVGMAGHGTAHTGDSRVDRKSTRLNSSHPNISYAVFCLKKKNKTRMSLMSNMTVHQLLVFRIGIIDGA